MTSIIINTLIKPHCIYAINDNNVFYQEIPEGKNQASNLTSSFDKILKENSIKKDDINFLLPVTGPGSFTSIRVCLTFTKAIICANKKIKIKPISSFQYILLLTKNNVKLDKQQYKAIAIESGRDETIFIQIFSNENKPIINGYEESFDSIKKLLDTYEDTFITTDLKNEKLDKIKKIKKHTHKYLDKKDTGTLSIDIRQIETANEDSLKAEYIRPHYANKS